MSSLKLIEAGLDDPDRQMALRITNYVGNMPLKRVVAIYALAIGMSFRGVGFQPQTSVLWAICEACRATWARDTTEPTGVCETCLGAGTVKLDGSPIRHEQAPPDEQQPCAVCTGTGRGVPKQKEPV